jgi:hypothetical protein
LEQPSFSVIDSDLDDDGYDFNDEVAFLQTYEEALRKEGVLPAPANDRVDWFSVKPAEISADELDYLLQTFAVTLATDRTDSMGTH